MQNDSDPHPIGEYRTNGTIKNMDTFYEAFDIKKGDPMYIAPEARVRLWPTK
jgi:predicted metalloendopeptidase